MNKEKRLKPYPTRICRGCGRKAHKKTFGNKYSERQFSQSTWHEGVCDICNKKKVVTEPRDFFFPRFKGTSGTKIPIKKASAINSKNMKIGVYNDADKSKDPVLNLDELSICCLEPITYDNIVGKCSKCNKISMIVDKILYDRIVIKERKAILDSLLSSGTLFDPDATITMDEYSDKVNKATGNIKELL